MRTPPPLRTSGSRKKEQEASGAPLQNLKNLASENGAGHFTIRAQRQHYGVRAGFAGLVTRRGQSHQKLIDLQAGDVHSASLSFYGAAPKEPCLVINKPEYLGAVTRLVFNLLAYLNWNDRDVVYRHPNKKRNYSGALAG